MMNSSLGGGFKTTDDIIGMANQYPGASKILNSLSIGAAGTNMTTNISQEDHSRMFGQAGILSKIFILLY